MKLNTETAALVFGVTVALMHLIWLLMVWVGIGQLYLDWIFGLHLISNPFRVMPFDLINALLLLIVTFTVGYISGLIFASVWNRLHKAG